MSDHVLSIDLGTTSLKAGVFDADGSCLDLFSQSHPTDRSDGGRADQDPAIWMASIDAAMAQFAQKGLLTRGMRGALTSQVNTHVFVDAQGAPLLPAIIWQDIRAAEEAAELDARVSEADKIAWFGAPIPIDASHALARMLWVQRHQPEIWARTAHVLLPKDYALLALTGELATDPLSNIGLVGTNGAYVGAMLDLVDGAKDRMAPLKGLTDMVGQTAHGVDMVTATMDGWVGLLGAGACDEGAFVYLSGTSEILGASSQSVTGEPGIVVFAPAEGLRLHAGPTQSGGASQDWLSALTGQPVADLAARVAGTERRQPTPLFLPQLAGERAPLWDPNLRGAFLGLEAGLEPSDLMRAVYEGVALSARHVMQSLEASCGQTPDNVTCGGGGFRSDPWGQIRADVLGKPLHRLAVNEPGLVGAAVLAFASAAGVSLAEAHAPFATYDRTWEPDPKRRALYDDLFETYLAAITANAPIGQQIVRQATR